MNKYDVKLQKPKQKTQLNCAKSARISSYIHEIVSDFPSAQFLYVLVFYMFDIFLMAPYAPSNSCCSRSTALESSLTCLRSAFRVAVGTMIRIDSMIKID